MINRPNSIMTFHVFRFFISSAQINSNDQGAKLHRTSAALPMSEPALVSSYPTAAAVTNANNDSTGRKKAFTYIKAQSLGLGYTSLKYTV
jgi:hypothetical protein